MKKIFLTAIAIVFAIAFTLAAPSVPTAAGDGLFDLRRVDVGNISDSENAEMEIELRNITGAPFSIENIDTSCGCTVANATEGPIAPGETAKVRVTIDTRGKMGEISKEIKLFTSGGSDPHVLTLTGKVEHFGEGMPDPSVIFEGDCSVCHVGLNVEMKQGQVLYNSICYLCHKDGLSPEAAVSVGLSNVIARGIPGTSMPGYLKKAGGPLSMEQVESLTDYIREKFYKGN
jgi:hypothetical protein